MTLMWNHENCLGHPNSPKASDMWQGLKPFGRQVVERMGELHMIVDISHASDGTARDALECARGPVVASHSNCRALCPHPRNLTDEMLRAWPTGAAWRALISMAPSWEPRQNPGSRRWFSMCFI